MGSEDGADGLGRVGYNILDAAWVVDVNGSIGVGFEPVADPRRGFDVHDGRCKSGRHLALDRPRHGCRDHYGNGYEGEAAVVAVFYSLFVAMVIYRSVTLRDLVRIFADAAVTSSVIMFIVVFAGFFSSAASTIGLVDAMANGIIKLAGSPLAMILLVNVFLLLLGMFLDAISITYLVMPILIPVMARFGIDPLWYGVVFVTALAIGQTTPPFGMLLFVMRGVAPPDITMRHIYAAVAPFVTLEIGILIFLILVPGVVTWLPRLMAG